MKISFERSGGVAGIRLAATIETEALAETERRRIERLVESIANGSASRSPSGPAPDRFQYRLQLKLGGKEIELSWSEAEVPRRLRPLIDWLTKRSRSRRTR